MNNPNVLLLSIDSLRPDRLGFFGRRPSPSPSIDRLLAGGMSLSRCFATGCPTMFALPGLMTSTLPLDGDGYEFGVRGRDVTLAEVFESAGYDTGALVAGMALDRPYGYARGFKDYNSAFDIRCFAKGCEHLYLRFLRREFKYRRIGFGTCVRILQPQMAALFEAAILFCEEKEAEIRGRELLLSPLIHEFDFASLRTAFEADRAALEAAPERFIGDLLVRPEGVSPIPCLPYSGDSEVELAGFETQIGGRAFRQSRHGAAGVSAAWLLHNAMRWLAPRTGKPWFLWVHLSDIHDRCFTSYDMPDAGLQEQDVAALTQLRAVCEAEGSGHNGSLAYDFSVHYVDRQVGRFLDALREQDLLSNTLLVLTSDHGHTSADWPVRPKIDIVDFYDELIHVPAVFLHPEINPSKVAALCSSLDIAPTMLQLAGLKIPPAFRGQPLQPGSPGRSHVIAEHLGRGPYTLELKPVHVCVRSQTHKVVVVAPPPQSNGAPVVREIYDLQRDPQELSNLAGPGGDRAPFESLISAAQQRAREIQSAASVARATHPPGDPVRTRELESELRQAMYGEVLEELATAHAAVERLQKTCDERLQLIHDLDRTAAERLELIERLDGMLKTQGLEPHQ